MIPKFDGYLNAIEVTSVIKERAEKIFAFYKILCPEELADIFISEYIKKDGNREYQSLWFFSANYVMEAKNFMLQDDFDITPIKKLVSYCNLISKDFDFENASEDSRALFKWSVTHLVNGELKASKSNCMFLKPIILKYFIPNMKA